MKITVDNKVIDVDPGQPLIASLRQAGCDIPSLCYSDGHQHQASCMVCMVRDVTRNQMIPSCSTYPTEGMCIDTTSAQVRDLRRMSLDLLLSDHRADCEAPCTVVCPSHIDVAQLLLHFDRGQMAQAHGILAAAVPDTSNLPCSSCKAPCEKACRRRTVDTPVSIRDIIRQVASDATPASAATSYARTDKGTFSSKLGRYTDAEKEWLRAEYDQPSHCLHCACEGRSGCQLRAIATQCGIRAPRYGVSSHLPVKESIHVQGRLYFEPAKCVRCGLCVYNTQDGFTFMHRGFDMQVIIPAESCSHVTEDVASLCPTGALYLRDPE